MANPIIYVLSVYYYTSGGAETLHQLVNRLRLLGKNAQIYYVDNVEASVQPDKFKDYNIVIAHEIEDSENNIMIVPETKTEYCLYYKKIRKAIWWLSLNFYLYFFPNIHADIITKRFMLPSIAKPFISGLLRIKQRKLKYITFNKDNINDFYHLYNCEYAHQYVIGLGAAEERTIYLCGPLNKTYFDKYESVDIKEKKDIIVYNPKKGKFFINALMKYAKKKRCSAKFVALENMTTQEVFDNICSAKLFVDFGEFPGPERIPRESVLLKCKRKNIPFVYTKMIEMIEHYKEYISDFDKYREKVLCQPERFDEGINKLIDICENTIER